MSSLKDPYSSPSWSHGTRLAIGLIFVLLSAVVLLLLRTLVMPFIIAVLLAYFLDPVATWLTKRSPLTRGWSTLVIFIILVGLIGGIVYGLGVAFSQRIVDLAAYFVEISETLPAQLEALTMSKVVIGPYVVDLSQVNITPFITDITSVLSPALSQAGSVMGTVAIAAASTIWMLIVILIIAYYLLLDFGKVGSSILEIIPHDHRDDIRRLFHETGRIWNAFLRGQTLLALIMALIVSVTMSLLGVNFALILGLIAGLAEFVPMFGPIFAGFVAVVVTLFQAENIWGLSPLTFTLIVLVVFTIIQQFENAFLAPKIIGVNLDLHPLVVFVAILAGGILFGIIGILVAAPMVALTRLWGGYLYRKVVGLDTPPPPILEPIEEPKSAKQMRETLGRLIGRIRKSEPETGQDIEDDVNPGV
ncbi:MAG: AI-2E family transporter [Anaerolineales bacterium]